MASLKDFGKSLPIIGGLLGGGPKAGIVDLDSRTKDLIHEGVQRSINESDSDIANQIGQGVEENVNALSPSDLMVDQQAASSAQDPNMMKAIQNKFRGETQKDLKRFKTQSELQGKLIKSQRMQQMSQQAMARQNVQTQNFAMLSQAYQQNEAARAGVISSIIGLGTDVAMVGGMPPNSRRTQTAVNAFNNSNDSWDSMGVGQFSGNNQNMMA